MMIRYLSENTSSSILAIDADRVVVATEKGELLDGDHLMAISAKHM